jgi:pterin-4a-carbinolamine dehydratase
LWVIAETFHDVGDLARHTVAVIALFGSRINHHPEICNRINRLLIARPMRFREGQATQVDAISDNEYYRI